jgi:hypothetical protein
MTVTNKRDWKKTLRTIKSELSPELREAARRMKQAQRRHSSVNSDIEAARRIRTEALKRELRK